MATQPQRYAPAWMTGYWSLGRMAAIAYAIVVLVLFVLGRLTGVELVLFALIAAALLLP